MRLKDRPAYPHQVERRIPCVPVDTQNNSRNTSPHQQMAPSSAGIRAAVERLMESGSTTACIRACQHAPSAPS